MMKSWEFLIQKKGINSWFPLNTQKLKLSAGTYRMVAQSHHPHLDVEIRVTHLQETIPPKRRTQKRQARTNQEGLLALVPFLNFTPGLWQICCSGAAMSEQVGKSWQEVVQIRVESQGAIAPEELSDPIETKETPEVSPEPERAVVASPAIAASALPEELVESTAAEIAPSTDDLSRADDAATDSESLSTEETREKENSKDINSLLDRSIENLEQILQQASQPRNEAIDEPEPPPAPVAAPPPEIPAEIANLQLHLTLYHDSFVRHGDESILVSGQVDAIAPPGDTFQALFASLDNIDAQLLLRYHLRDPQSSSFYDSASGWEVTPSQLLFDSQQTDSEATLPQIFGYNLQIPPEYRAPLILGEAILELSLCPRATGSRSVAILARQPFSISAALDELLEAAFPSESVPQVGAEAQESSEIDPPTTINTDFVEIARSASQAHQFQPTAPQILPPKLSASSAKQTYKFVQLPEFPTSQPEMAEEQILEQAESKAVEAVPETAEAPTTASIEELEPQALEAESDLPADLADKREENEISFDSLEPDEEEVSEPAEPSELDNEFQSLRLQERFWSRMNSLAEDAPSFAAENLTDDATAPAISEEPKSEIADEEAASLEQAGEEAPTESVVVNPSPEVELPFGNLISSDLPLLGEGPETEEEETVEETLAAAEIDPPPDLPEDRIDLEIVVEDDDDLLSPSPLKHDASGLPYPADVKVSARKPMGEVARNVDAPVAAPILEVSEGELVAGDPVIVRVKLLPNSGTVYVKLWVQDCQTRHLLDGPRAFVDFMPNPAGELETVTQLSIPQGSLEIRFEAIAIDVETQRESHKAIVERRVMPPDLLNPLGK